jgi:hypothetical protein
MKKILNLCKIKYCMIPTKIPAIKYDDIRICCDVTRSQKQNPFFGNKFDELKEIWKLNFETFEGNVDYTDHEHLSAFQMMWVVELKWYKIKYYFISFFTFWKPERSTNYL